MPTVSTYSAHLQFGAAHRLVNHPQCGRVHGHSYHVTLTWSGVPMREHWGYPVTLVDVNKANDIVFELSGRNLNDMLPAGEPSVSGIAAYLLERTRILGVTRVEVHESDTDVTGTALYMAG